MQLQFRNKKKQLIFGAQAGWLTNKRQNNAYIHKELLVLSNKRFEKKLRVVTSIWFKTALISCFTKEGLMKED